MKLDRWLIHGNVLVGYLYDSKEHPQGTRVMTSAIRFINPLSMEAECLDGKYMLMDPGTSAEHNQPMIGKKPESKMPEIDSKIFLTPKG